MPGLLGLPAAFHRSRVAEPGGRLRAALDEGLQRACAACARLCDWLADSYLPHAPERDAVGRDLKDFHGRVLGCGSVGLAHWRRLRLPRNEQAPTNFVVGGE
jgi:uncharacterized protein (DUF885 family)